MIKKCLLLLITCLGISGYSQEIKRDSIPHQMSNRQFGSEKQISIRVGAGIQRSFYTELGVALHKCNYGDTGFFSNDAYIALEWTPDSNQDLYGVKIGYEANPMGLNAGIEVKYLTDFEEKDIVFTPKIGLGIFGDLNLFYGYNISANKNPFSEITGRHQFSIVLNLNNHFLSYR